MYEDLSLEESHRVLVNKIAELREVFPFPEDKDIDKGYPSDKKDGLAFSRNSVLTPYVLRCNDTGFSANIKRGGMK
jgi:hypothetical protein